MILHWRIRTRSDWWFSKFCRSGLDEIQPIESGLDSDWKFSQSANFC